MSKETNRKEMKAVLEIIGKYWLEFLLGVIATGLSIACKKFYALYKSEQNHQKSKEQKEFQESLEGLITKSAEESRRGDEKLQAQINAMQKQNNIMQEGILSLQGRTFKQECRRLLMPDQLFTLEEFETLQDEYDVYKILGGNHDGDTLFELVKKKATNILTDGK